MKSQSQYTDMLLEWGEIPLSDILYAGIFQWLLLAGYLVLPGTFISLQKSNALQETLTGNSATEMVLHVIQNPPLLGITCFFSLVGLGGLIWLAHLFQSVDPYLKWG
jgi:hypothetical protein